MDKKYKDWKNKKKRLDLGTGKQIASFNLTGPSPVIFVSAFPKVWKNIDAQFRKPGYWAIRKP